MSVFWKQHDCTSLYVLVYIQNNIWKLTHTGSDWFVDTRVALSSSSLSWSTSVLMSLLVEWVSLLLLLFHKIIQTVKCTITELDCKIFVGAGSVQWQCKFLWTQRLCNSKRCVDNRIKAQAYINLVEILYEAIKQSNRSNFPSRQVYSFNEQWTRHDSARLTAMLDYISRLFSCIYFNVIITCCILPSVSIWVGKLGN